MYTWASSPHLKVHCTSLDSDSLSWGRSAPTLTATQNLQVSLEQAVDPPPQHPHPSSTVQWSHQDSRIPRSKPPPPSACHSPGGVQRCSACGTRMRPGPSPPHTHLAVTPTACEKQQWWSHRGRPPCTHRKRWGSTQVTKITAEGSLGDHLSQDPAVDKGTGPRRASDLPEFIEQNGQTRALSPTSKSSLCAHPRAPCTQTHRPPSLT